MSSKPTILIADDDDRVLKALIIRLGSLGFHIITATDGFNALAMATKHAPALLVLDVNMPAGDGFSVQERLKHIDGLENTPVIYLTGDKSARLDEMARQLGAYALLHKPFDIENLIDAILSALSPPKLAG